MIFGSDWPGVPGIAANLRAIAKLDIGLEDLPAVLGGNARRVYRDLDASLVD
jgi:predicted TIM-barrel fold metal-dependent hydrolase